MSNAKGIGLISYARYAVICQIQDKQERARVEFRQNSRAKQRVAREAERKMTGEREDGWHRNEQKPVTMIPILAEIADTDIELRHFIQINGNYFNILPT